MIRDKMGLADRRPRGMPVAHHSQWEGGERTGCHGPAMIGRP